MDKREESDRQLIPFPEREGKKENGELDIEYLRRGKEGRRLP